MLRLLLTTLLASVLSLGCDSTPDPIAVDSDYLTDTWAFTQATSSSDGTDYTEFVRGIIADLAITVNSDSTVSIATDLRNEDSQDCNGSFGFTLDGSEIQLLDLYPFEVVAVNQDEMNLTGPGTSITLLFSCSNGFFGPSTLHFVRR